MSKFAKFLQEIEAMGNRREPRLERSYTPQPGITHEELRKALMPKESSPLTKAIAHVKRFQASIKETLKSEAEKKQIAAQGRIQHQRVVLQKLGEMRELVKQALVAGEITGDEAASLETRLNAESERLYNRHVATLTESGVRKIEPITAGGGR